MILPSELIVHISSFLELKDYIMMTGVCRWWYRVLSTLLCVRTGIHDELVGCAKILRGYNRFYHGLYLRCSLTFRPLPVHDLRYVAGYDCFGQYSIDLFGRLWYDQWRPRLLMSTRQYPVFGQRLLVKQVYTSGCLDDYHLHRLCSVVFLDHQGTIIVGDKHYPAQAWKILAHEDDEVLFLDAKRRCFCLDLSTGQTQYLTTIPYPNFALTRMKEGGYRLDYYLTHERDLYFGYDTSIDRCDLHQAPIPVRPSGFRMRQGVKKMIWFARDNYCYLSTEGELILHRDRRELSLNERRTSSNYVCLIRDITDAAGEERSLYVLKGRVILHSDISEPQFRFEVIYDGLTSLYKHIEVLDDDVVHLW